MLLQVPTLTIHSITLAQLSNHSVSVFISLYSFVAALLSYAYDNDYQRWFPPFFMCANDDQCCATVNGRCTSKVHFQDRQEEKVYQKHTKVDERSVD